MGCKSFILQKGMQFRRRQFVLKKKKTNKFFIKLFLEPIANKIPAILYV